MGRLDHLEEVYAVDRKTFREWLAAHHETSPGIWLVYYKKAAPHPSIDYDGAVREALCFGWIDSTVRSIDEHRYKQLFTPRKPGSTWSRSNKDRIDELLAEGAIAPPGQAVIDAARADGSWTLLDSVDALEMPDDLVDALEAAGEDAWENWERWPDSEKKGHLWRIISAKRETTRARRIADTAARARDDRRIT